LQDGRVVAVIAIACAGSSSLVVFNWWKVDGIEIWRSWDTGFNIWRRARIWWW
jgi:hypothetical protein